MSFVFQSMTRINRGPRGTRTVFRDVDLEFPEGRSVGILGAHNSGKTTLIRLLARLILPTRGRIIPRCRVSFPVNFGGGFNNHLSGRENAVFLARLYGLDPTPFTRFVRDFSELGREFDEPLMGYSTDKRTRFTFTVSYAIPFECYIADGTLMAGSPAFREKCQQLILERRKNAVFVFATHAPKMLVTFADIFGVLDNGTIRLFENVKDAVEAWRATVTTRESVAEEEEQRPEEEEEALPGVELF